MIVIYRILYVYMNSGYVQGRPFLFRIPAKDTVVVFYSTLSPQKCTKLNIEKQHAQGHLGSNLTPGRKKIKILEKQLSLTAQNHYADLQETCDKVTKVCVIVKYTKNVIEKKRRLGSNLTPGGRLRVNLWIANQVWGAKVF